MTSATSKALQEYLSSHGFIYLTTSASLVAVLLLVFVGIEREILRAIKPDSARRNVAAFAIVVIPTFIVFATVIVTRFVRLS